MLLGKVVGTVVATKKNDGISGLKYLLVRTCDCRGNTKDGYLVAVDLVGCGSGEMVLVSQGSSARQTDFTKEKAVDCVIVGIVDLIEKMGEIVFKKSAPGREAFHEY